MTSKRLAGGLLITLLACGAALGQSLDNKGTDFIVSFLPNFGTPNAVELHLTSDVNTDVTIEYPVNSPTFTTTVGVGPGSITTVGLPVAASTGWTPGIVQNNSVRALADQEFVCYMINRQVATSDAALALPIDTMNTEYIVTTYFSAIVSSDRAEFAVVAGFDDTTVTITPTKALAGGFAAGVPFDVELDRGQAFYGQSVTSGTTGDLTGTIVEADRPVGMTNGNKCTNVPPNITACDHIFEVAQPVQTWGNQALVANLPNRPSGSVYRIVASLDATAVTQDGAALGTIDRGEFIEVGPLAGDHVFAADNPIFVVQFMSGDSSPGATLGDPAMGNVIPPEQYPSAYTFSTVGGSQFLENFLTVIAEDADVATILLDGATIGAGSFTTIPGTGFSVARVPIEEGTHTTSSEGVHGITVEGYNDYDSYLYPGGALFQFINPVGDENPPLCFTELVPGQPPSVAGSAQDDRPSEDTNGNGELDDGEDLNGNGLIDEDTGIFFVELLAGSQNLSLTVDAFVPGDGFVTFTVELINPDLPGNGTVRVTDGAGNTCESLIAIGLAPTCDAGGPYAAECQGGATDIALDGTGSSDPDEDPLSYSWSTDCPGGSFDDPNSPTPTLTVTSPPDSAVECSVTLTVNDGTEPSECSAPVTVSDTTAPDIQCPPNVEVASDASTDPADTGTPTVDDGCDPSPEVSFADGVEPGPCPGPAQAVITRTWTATDAAGNEKTCVQTITVLCPGEAQEVPPAALDQVEIITCDIPHDFIFDCRDANGDPLTARIVSGPTPAPGAEPNPGVLIVDGINGSYTPATQNDGLYVAEYVCNDGTADSNVAELALWVLTCERGTGTSQQPVVTPPGGGAPAPTPTTRPTAIVPGGCGSLGLASISLMLGGLCIARLGGRMRRRRA